MLAFNDRNILSVKNDIIIKYKQYKKKKFKYLQEKIFLFNRRQIKKSKLTITINEFVRNGPVI